MPKLDQILSQSTPSAVALPRQSARSLGAPALAAAQGFTAIGKVAAEIGGQIAKANEAARRQQALMEAERAESRFEIAVSDLTSSVKQSTTDPDEAMRTWERGFGDAVADARKGLTDPDIAATFERKLPDLTRRHYAEALKHRDTLRVGRIEGDLTATLDERRQLASRLSIGDEAGAAEQYTKGLQAIQRAAPTLGEKRAIEEAIKFRDSVIGERARRHANEDPTGFLADVGTSPFYRHLDPMKRDAVVEHARTVERQQAEGRDKAEAAAAKRLEAERTALVVEFDRRVREAQSDEDRRGILTELNLRQELRQIDSAAYRRLYDEIRAPKDAPSDAAVLSRVGLDVHALRPRTTEADIDRLHAAYRAGGPGLNYRDAVAAKDRLRQTANTLREQGESALVREHGQAEQLLGAALGIRPGLVAQALGDDPASRLYAAGLQELTRRSRLFGGKEDPLVIAQEMAPRYQGALGTSARLKPAELQALYPTPQALEQAYRRGIITDRQYQEGRRQMLDAPPQTPATSGKAPRPRL